MKLNLKKDIPGCIFLLYLYKINSGALCTSDKYATHKSYALQCNLKMS